jgi:plastocyanin
MSLGATRRSCVAAVCAAAILATVTGFFCFPAQAADTQVVIDGFTFTPERIVVKPGSTITWVNDDDSPHTVVSSSKLFKSKTLDTTDKFSFTFTTPGAYEYFCSLHPHMTGTIVVEALSGSSATQ